MPPCLIQHYKVRIKGKVEQSRERSSTLPYTSEHEPLKREPSVPLDKGHQLFFTSLSRFPLLNFFSLLRVCSTGKYFFNPKKGNFGKGIFFSSDSFTINHGRCFSIFRIEFSEISLGFFSVFSIYILVFVCFSWCFFFYLFCALPTTIIYQGLYPIPLVETGYSC